MRRGRKEGVTSARRGREEKGCKEGVRRGARTCVDSRRMQKAKRLRYGCDKVAKRVNWRTKSALTKSARQYVCEEGAHRGCTRNVHKHRSDMWKSRDARDNDTSKPHTIISVCVRASSPEFACAYSPEFARPFFCSGGGAAACTASPHAHTHTSSRPPCPAAPRPTHRATPPAYLFRRLYHPIVFTFPYFFIVLGDSTRL